ncbi:MAG TPA: PAS domain S-box protein [Verrucomicrobiae bacterium]
MNKELFILVLEDSAYDAALIDLELEKSGFKFKSQRVETKDEFVSGLNQHPDIILSDHGLPLFDSFMALKLAKEQAPDVPFIFVTGNLGEEVAIKTFKCGATDYVLKSKLSSNLALAVRRAVREAEERKLRKEVEDALRESEARFRMLMEGVKDYALCLLDPEGKVVSWNSGSTSLKGYGNEDILGQNFSRFYIESDRQKKLPEHALRQAATDSRFEEEGWRVRKDGSTFWANTVITALEDPEGNLQGFALVTRDVTERRRVFEALHASEARKKAILDTALDAIISIDSEGLIREWNPAAERMFGHTHNEIIGRSMEEIVIAPALRKLYQDGLTNYLIHGVGSLIGHRMELTAQRADGSEFPVEMAITRVVDGQLMLTCFVRDIAKRKEAEMEIWRLNSILEDRVMQRTAELEAANKELEAFSYSVSHDLRAPLRHINGFVEMLQQRLGGRLDEEDAQLFKTIAAAASRMGKLIDDLLAFSQMNRTELRKVPVGLEKLVNEVRETVSHDLNGRKVAWEIGPLPEVLGDMSLLRQALINLMSNALKYTRQREEAHIKVGSMQAKQEHVIYVQDNGVGFDMKYSDKLFGVFQRLHRAADFEGTGIGLANVRRIINRHGGRTWAKGKLGKGATFYFSLPKSI